MEDIETGSTQNGFPCGSSFSDSALSCGCCDWCCCKFCNMGSSTLFRLTKIGGFRGCPIFLNQKSTIFRVASFFPLLRCEQRCSVSEMTMRVGKVLHLGGLDPVVMCLSKYHRHPLLLHGSFKYVLVYHHNIHSNLFKIPWFIVPIEIPQYTITTSIQWQFQDPKMELLYPIRPYFCGNIHLHRVGTSNFKVPEMAIDLCTISL